MKLSPAQKPAMFLVQEGSEYTFQSETTPAKVALHCKVFIYTAAGKDPNSIPATQMNNILDAIDSVLAPSDLVVGRQTLGGLVSHCRIEGMNLEEDGSLDGDGLAVLNIKLFLPVGGM